MIQPYKFINTDHQKLNRYVISFFRNIKDYEGDFSDELFDSTFLPIVKTHKIILYKQFQIIFNLMNEMSIEDKRYYINSIFESNEIEKICRRELIPKKFLEDLAPIDKEIKKLFLNLYNQVLNGVIFCSSITKDLRDHFNEFCDENNEITLCPVCGIGELKKSCDEIRDQYDHYLPKSKYPLSSVNFYNLMPICRECNSFEVKGEKDILAEATGKLFFPYDENHSGISMIALIQEDKDDISNIEWNFQFSNDEGKNEEIESWKTIYNIESRYKGYIKGRIVKWYRIYFDYLNSSEDADIPLDYKKRDYFRFLSCQNALGATFIIKPVLNTLLQDSLFAQAEIEALEYSLY